MKGFIIAVGLFLVAASTASAQQAAPAGGHDAQSTACTYNFGSGNFVWCVSDTGNLMRLTSPSGFEHVRLGAFDEGYVLCATGLGPYYDNGDNGNAGWGAPVLVAAPSSTGVKIRRTSTDGRWSLEHQFKSDKTERDITVTMVLTNLSGATQTNVQLLRTVDYDMDNSTGGDIFDRSADGTWTRETHGGTLSAITYTEPHTAGVLTSISTNVCNPAVSAVPTSPTDLGVFVQYNLGNLAAGKKKTVKVAFRIQ
jgi:hypothetical protein